VAASNAREEGFDRGACFYTYRPEELEHLEIGLRKRAIYYEYPHEKVCRVCKKELRSSKKRNQTAIKANFKKPEPTNGIPRRTKNCRSRIPKDQYLGGTWNPSWR